MMKRTIKKKREEMERAGKEKTRVREKERTRGKERGVGSWLTSSESMGEHGHLHPSYRP